MNQGYKAYGKILEDLVKVYEDAKKNYNAGIIEQTTKTINKVRERYVNYLTEINDLDSMNQVASMLKDFDDDQIERVVIKPDDKATIFAKMANFMHRHKAKVALAGALITGVTLVSCTSQMASNDVKPKTVETTKIKEQDQDYSSDNLIENGVNFAKLSAKYGQYLGYSSEDLAYLSTEFTGYIPDPHTAEKFNMPELISAGDAQKAISHTKTTFDNMFHLGLDETDKEAFINLFDNEDDKKIIGGFLDIYYNAYSNPTSTEAKDKLIEELKDYVNQNNTASTDMANLFLASGFDAIRGVTLIGARTAQDEQIEILTDSIIKNININVAANGAGCVVVDEKTNENVDKKTENQSVYTNIRENLEGNYKDFVQQASFAKDSAGSTTLDMSGKEIAKAIKEQTKDLKNSEIDVTEEIADGYRERYDNSPAEQARQKVTSNDVIKKDPTTGENYIHGGTSSEDLSEKPLPNKDPNGNETDMSKDEMLDYADLAAKDFNAGTKNEKLYNSNSVYKKVWDELKAFQDANNVAPPTQNEIVDEKTEVEIKPSVDQSNNQGTNNNNNSNEQNNNQGTSDNNASAEQDSNKEEELPIVPEDYVPPKPGEIVDVEEEVEFVPNEQQFTDADIMRNQMEDFHMNADGSWEMEETTKTR